MEENRSYEAGVHIIGLTSLQLMTLVALLDGADAHWTVHSFRKLYGKRFVENHIVSDVCPATYDQLTDALAGVGIHFAGVAEKMESIRKMIDEIPDHESK